MGGGGGGGGGGIFLQTSNSQFLFWPLCTALNICSVLLLVGFVVGFVLFACMIAGSSGPSLSDNGHRVGRKMLM